MTLAHSRAPWFLVALGLALGACEQSVTTPDADLPVVTRYARADAAVGRSLIVPSLVQQIDAINARLASQGSSVRLDYPWMFVVGPGTDPYARLRTGARWMTLDPTYVLDASDYTSDLPAAQIEAALGAAYEAWNSIPNAAVHAHRVPDVVANPDYLDGTYDGDGNCLDVADPDLGPFDEGDAAADIVVGGWLPDSYFTQCIGIQGVIAVTWTYINVDEDINPVDTNGDHYADRVYVEQYFNAKYQWVTTGSVYLDFMSPLMDLQTIATHENGHAHGLGHFGGPVRLQPLKVQPNLKVFNPEAVMNPGYLFGEKRSLYPTDVAAMQTMYSRE